MSAATTKPRAVRCVCKNRDRHFGVCKCHRHKGDTVSVVVLGLDMAQKEDIAGVQKPRAEDGQTDVWWCAKCDREWTVASIPHNPTCPTCGASGWWRRFAA